MDFPYRHIFHIRYNAKRKKKYSNASFQLNRSLWYKIKYECCFLIVFYPENIEESLTRC